MNSQQKCEGESIAQNDIVLTEDEIQSNKEMFLQEVEALAMTLNELELQIEQSEITIVKLAIKPQEFDKPVIMTTSRQQTELPLKKFPVIRLTITIPQSYPSQQAPTVELEGFYKKFDKEIKQYLQDKWMADQLVLYEWYSDCQNDLLAMLLEQEENCQLTNIEFQQLKEEQYESLKFEISTSDQMCNICYQQFMGSDKFVILMGCLHYFCKGCMRQYCEGLITSGQISRLICPQQCFPPCKTSINEANFREIGMSEELIEKVLTFSINQAVDSMDDFGWCPNQDCGAPAEIDLLKNFGKCTHCNYLFCLTCKDKYHFFKRCPSLQLEYEEYKDFKSLKEQNINRIQEKMNEYYIYQCTKACPSCNFMIQKIEGCNKMTCSRCGKFFCWNCLSIIQGYEHFSDNPLCGDIILAQIPDRLEEDTLDQNKAEINIMTAALKESVVCPKCRQINSKQGTINLLSCFKCQNSFCFQCGRNAPDGKQHYDVTNCYYENQAVQVN